MLGLLLSAVRAKDIDDSAGRPAAAARGRCTALSSKYGHFYCLYCI